jgi:DNA-binding transcriptional LysR family regulator
MVAADLEVGRLVRLKVSSWDGSDQMPRLATVIAHRRDRALGPAGRWLVERLADGDLTT